MSDIFLTLTLQYVVVSHELCGLQINEDCELHQVMKFIRGNLD